MTETDIVKRLRDRIHDAPMPSERMMDEAADIIESLHTQRNKLRELLSSLHAAVDRQVRDQLTDEYAIDAPPDREYDVRITAQQAHDLTEAFYLLERLATSQSLTDAEVQRLRREWNERYGGR